MAYAKNLPLASFLNAAAPSADGDLDGFINAYLTCEATGTWATK